MALKRAAGLPREAGRLLGLVVHGFEVYYDPNTDQLAHAAGLFRRKRLVVGPIWWNLRSRERHAVLLHEVGHCIYRHLEVRVALIPLFWTAWVARLAQRQELQADAFVREQGYGADLMAVLRRYESEQGEFYPSIDERAAVLLPKELPDAVAA